MAPGTQNPTVDDRNPALLMTLDYGSYGILPIRGNAGFL